MNTELTMVVYSVVLTFVLIMIPAFFQILQNGLATQAGSRDGLPEPTAFIQRARRLQANMIENMVLFVPLVLVVQAAGVSNSTTAAGAELFVVARVIHALIYLGGIPWIRPLAWAGSVVGMIMIASSLLWA
ncbi:MAG: MAPEG family protein [Myxococcota bacterium]|nr:MAPEG family protein [Myxococcota bacterium]